MGRRGNPFTRPRTPEEYQESIAQSKAKLKFRNSVNAGRKDETEVININYQEMQERIFDVRFPLTLSWVHISEIHLDKTGRIRNQIMVMYANGSFDIMPQHVNGPKIRDYIGFKYSRIEYWCALPINTSPDHFHTTFHHGATPFNKASRDIFDKP